MTLGLGVLGVLPARSADASTETGPFIVAAAVNMSCAIAIVPMSFGNYYAPNAGAHDAVGRITLNCVAVANNLQARLESGLNGSGSAQAPVRNMLHATSGELLNYQLYRDAARTQVWGATPPTAVQPGNVPYPIDIPVYGRIPANQFVSSGTYTDTVQVTLLF